MLASEFLFDHQGSRYRNVCATCNKIWLLGGARRTWLLLDQAFPAFALLGPKTLADVLSAWPGHR